MATYAQERVANETIVEWLGNDSMVKRAEDAINAFTRLKVREDGIHRRVQPYLQLANDDLDRDLQDKPVKYVDKEPDGPPAVMVPFATLPMNVYINGPRYRVLFARIQSVNFTKDVDELRTWYMDIRQVMSDNMIKDMLYAEDSAWFTASNAAMGGSVGATSPLNGGSITWQAVSGGITRDGMLDAFKILPGTYAHLETKTFLINNVSVNELQKWGRDEMGGNLSEDIVKDGWNRTSFLGKEMLVTIKRDLVPDDSIYMYADPKFLGKAYVLEDTTMCIEKRAFMINWFSWETIGSALASGAAAGRADF